jgi:hypothetical protein
MVMMRMIATPTRLAVLWPGLCCAASMRSGRVHSHTIWKKTGRPR